MNADRSDKHHSELLDRTRESSGFSSIDRIHRFRTRKTAVCRGWWEPATTNRRPPPQRYPDWSLGAHHAALPGGCDGHHSARHMTGPVPSAPAVMATTPPGQGCRRPRAPTLSSVTATAVGSSTTVELALDLKSGRAAELQSRATRLKVLERRDGAEYVGSDWRRCPTPWQRTKPPSACTPTTGQNNLPQLGRRLGTTGCRRSTPPARVRWLLLPTSRSVEHCHGCDSSGQARASRRADGDGDDGSDGRSPSELDRARNRLAPHSITDTSIQYSRKTASLPWIVGLARPWRHRDHRTMTPAGSGYHAVLPGVGGQHRTAWGPYSATMNASARPLIPQGLPAAPTGLMATAWERMTIELFWTKS